MNTRKNKIKARNQKLDVPVVIKSEIIRGQLHFVTDGYSIQCWLGEPNDPESEYVFGVNKMFAKDIVAGLKAIEQHCL